MVPWSVQKPFLKQSQVQYQQRYHTPSNFGHHGSGIHSKFGVGGYPWRAQPQFYGQSYQRRPPPMIPATYQVNPDARYTGTVQFYNKFRGFGFIEPTQKGVIPSEKIFVHWKSILSDDRFPFLSAGVEVEFGLIAESRKYGGGNTLRCKNVTLVGGMSISLQDELDAQEKTFVGGQHLRYTGTLKFFSPRHGFGYVIMDQGYDVDASVPSEMRVDREEVNCGGQQPCLMQGIAVEFGIWRNEAGRYLIYNMTLPGGHPLTQDALENRISMDAGWFTGQVVIWNWRHGWGFVRADPATMLPPRVLQKLAEQAQAARARGRVIKEDKMLYFRRSDVSPGLLMNQGMQVNFQVYIDDKGAGACSLQA
eukprot:TRINITY_DN64920_c0_g1_i1.p1 TRINITY_DN64920_c0_g1~~TRINITY_DN64920_c0_g1_i1.p1  ORF type:complete len:364 (+),score=53.69 TRINITY_DN64920_c0_g1_i1:58-1149(+)